jgi:hypothetical protein
MFFPGPDALGAGKTFIIFAEGRLVFICRRLPANKKI